MYIYSLINKFLKFLNTNIWVWIWPLHIFSICLHIIRCAIFHSIIHEWRFIHFSYSVCIFSLWVAWWPDGGNLPSMRLIVGQNCNWTCKATQLPFPPSLYFFFEEQLGGRKMLSRFPPFDASAPKTGSTKDSAHLLAHSADVLFVCHGHAT